MGPVVVGGIGGSGTRVVAELLQKAGVDIGSDLNDSLDNLWFTLLFKRPGWFAGACDDETDAALAILEKAMRGGEPWSAAECAVLWSAACEISGTGHDHLGHGQGEWPFVRMARMIDRPARAARPSHWGWKEPNTHVYLEAMATHWADLRYVLVLRHGLDMAFSSNHAQLHNWGPTFGISRSDGEPVERSLLRYWLSATTRAIDVGERLLGSRFVVVDYDELCSDPSANVPMLLARLALATSVRMDNLAAVPRRNASRGRYRSRDLSIFSVDELDAVRRLGYSV